jgi:hypothetical protein
VVVGVFAPIIITIVVEVADDEIIVEVTHERSCVNYVYGVLGVAGVGNILYPRCLVGVVARARDLERLVYVPALGLLLYPVPEAEEVAVVISVAAGEEHDAVIIERRLRRKILNSDNPSARATSSGA